MSSIDTQNSALRLSVKAAIIIKIETKEWNISKPIPSPNKLAGWLGVKRSIINHVLHELILKGVLARRKGSCICILHHNISVNDL